MIFQAYGVDRTKHVLSERKQGSETKAHEASEKRIKKTKKNKPRKKL